MSPACRQVEFGGRNRKIQTDATWHFHTPADAVSDHPPPILENTAFEAFIKGFN